MGRGAVEAKERAEAVDISMPEEMIQWVVATELSLQVNMGVVDMKQGVVERIWVGAMRREVEVEEMGQGAVSVVENKMVAEMILKVESALDLVVEDGGGEVEKGLVHCQGSEERAVGHNHQTGF